MDNLILDAEVLRETADRICEYTRLQNEIMNEYVRNIGSLGNEWQDDRTFSSMIEEIMQLRAYIQIKMDGIKSYADYFRQRAEMIENRPSWGKTTGVSSLSERPEYSSSSFYRKQEMHRIQIMDKRCFDEIALEDDIRKMDNVGNFNGYLQTSSNQSRINDLEHTGRFLSPINGKTIIAKRIAYRGLGICTPNAQNVCGADFYYEDGTFCGSYVGASWQDIFELNFADTKQFRKIKHED